jgi:pimeloyl-ACP methyl ester carboxylesterase
MVRSASTAPISLRTLRTPDDRFRDLDGYPFAPHYLDDLACVPGARLHYLDEGDPTSDEVFLCLHGAPTWSYLYRKMIPIFAAPGHRVVAPDLIGCGRSDKLVRREDYSFHLHRDVLLEFATRLDLRNITLVCQDWGAILGMTLPLEMPERFSRLVVMNTALRTWNLRFNPTFRFWRLWAAMSPNVSPGLVIKLNERQLTRAERDGYDAPFPDRRYKVGARAFPALVPLRQTDEGADVLRCAERWWREDWRGDALMAIGTRDRALGRSTMLPLRDAIRNCPEPLLVDAGHYVQERGEVVAERALEHFGLAREHC